MFEKETKECHYPNMGEFPETSGDMRKDWKPVLIYTKELGWTVGMRFKKNRKHEWYCSNYDGNTIFLDEEIIAWKELPEPPKETKQDCTKCIHYAECYLRRHNEAIDYCQDFDKNPWEN